MELGNKLAITLATATLASAAAAPAEAAPTNGNFGPEAAAASFGWGNVGGDPLVRGGLDSRQDYVNLITSDKGTKAMKLMGLDANARKAWREGARKGKEVDCYKNTGDHFLKMTYGAGEVSVDSDVTLTDPDYKNSPLHGWCLPVKVGNKVYNTFVADVCANMTLANKTTTFTKPPKRVPKVEVDVVKQVKDSEGKLIPETPTGEFKFTISCLQNHRKLIRTRVYNHTPQVMASCDKGSNIKVTEADKSVTELAKNVDLWDNETPLSQTQVARLIRIKGKHNKGNRFTFINKQVKVETPEGPCAGNTTNTSTNNSGNTAQSGNCSTNIICSPVNSPNSEVCNTTTTTPPPPEKKNLPPSVNLIGWQHIKTGDVQQACAYESDPDGPADIASRSFSETGNGEFVSFAYPGDEAGEYCIDYKAGTTADNATITYKVVDKAGNTASDTEAFPIDDSTKGEF